MVVLPFTPPPLPPANLDWGALVRLVGPANAAVARYDGLIRGMPNPRVLLTPLTTREAVLSSKIEGTQTTVEEVLEADARGVGQGREYDDVREVINYRTALSLASDEVRERGFSSHLLRRMHATLLASVRGQDRTPGMFRRTQNWIGGPGTRPEGASYMPPEPHLVGQLMEGWEAYYHADEADRLAQAGLLHAQFELIHPFSDGNGRLGRMIIPLFLCEQGLLAEPTFYISEYLEAHRQQYVDRLGSISRTGDWQGWVEFFLRAVIAQAEENTRKCQDMIALYEAKKARVAEATHSQFAIQALDALFARPLFNSTEFVEASGIPKPTAATLLRKLAEEGVVAVRQPGRVRRPTEYAFTKLVELLRHV